LLEKPRERGKMSNKKFYMVLDTETTTEAKTVYDVAYTIIDRKGNIIEQANYLVKEITEHPFLKGILQRDKFSSRKYRETYADLYTNKKMVLPFLTIRQNIRRAIREYNCPVVAYNMAFDYEALTNMAQDLGKKSFFTAETQIWDLWNIALYTLCDSKNYVKFCDEHHFVNERGNRQTTAESVYRYITKDINFEEAHTALADTEIEAEILLACFKRHKKMHTDLVSFCPRHPVWKNRCKVA
jgi:DNA polymerase III epsilon subunit-like protein